MPSGRLQRRNLQSLARLAPIRSLHAIWATWRAWPASTNSEPSSSADQWLYLRKPALSEPLTSLAYPAIADLSVIFVNALILILILDLLALIASSHNSRSLVVSNIPTCTFVIRPSPSLLPASAYRPYLSTPPSLVRGDAFDSSATILYHYHLPFPRSTLLLTTTIVHPPSWRRREV